MPLMNETPNAFLVGVHRTGDRGVLVGYTTVSPLAPVSHFMEPDGICYYIVVLFNSGGKKITNIVG